MNNIGEQHRHLLVLRRWVACVSRRTALVAELGVRMAVRCRTTHRTAPSRSVHRHHPRWDPRQYRFTAGQRCPSYRRAISGTSISATVVGTSSIEVFAPTATTTPTAAGAAMSAGRRRTPCAPSARRQSRTGPADDEVRDRIDVAIESTNSQVDRRVRPIPSYRRGRVRRSVTRTDWCFTALGAPIDELRRDR